MLESFEKMYSKDLREASVGSGRDKLKYKFNFLAETQKKILGSLIMNFCFRRINSIGENS